MIRRLAAAYSHVLHSGCVLVASVHHTGTWFALEFLLWHSSSRRVVELSEILQGETLRPGDVVHLHLYGERGVSSRGRFVDDDEEEELAAMTAELVDRAPSLIPLRDPLKSLITREVRHPGWDHRFIVDGFSQLTRLSPTAWLPIDLEAGEAERHKRLAWTLELLGLDAEPYLLRYARDWTPQNTRGDYALKRLYQNGDLEGVRGRFPMCYDHLLRSSPRFLPFLRGIGYDEFPWEKA